MSSSNPKSRRDLRLIVQGRCPFPTKTNKTHGALKSSVGSQKQLILSCLDLVIADFWSTSCTHQGGLRSYPQQSVECLVNEKKQTISYCLHSILMMRGFEKHFRVKSSDIKTWRFDDDMSPLSNASYNKIVNVIYTIVSDKLHQNKRGGNKQKNGKIF